MSTDKIEKELFFLYNNSCYGRVRVHVCLCDSVKLLEATQMPLLQFFPLYFEFVQVVFSLLFEEKLTIS